MRRTTLLIVSLVAAVFTLACAPPTSPLGVVGTYALQSVNGMPLPYLLQDAGATKVHVLDDLIILTSSSSFSEMGHKTLTTGSMVSLQVPIDAGTFERRGNTITLESLLFGRWTGSIRGSTLTMVQQGFTLVYQK